MTAWVDWHVPEHATFAKPRLPAVFVTNSSGAAVYDAFFDYRDPVSGASFRKPIGPVPPRTTRVSIIDYEGHLDHDWEPAAMFPRLNFRDAASNRWIRDAMGRLKPDNEWGDDDFYRDGGVLLPPD